MRKKFSFIFMILCLMMLSSCVGKSSDDRLYDSYLAELKSENELAAQKKFNLQKKTDSDYSNNFASTPSEKIKITITGEFEGVKYDSIQTSAEEYMSLNPNVQIVLDKYPHQKYLDTFPVLVMTKDLGDVVFLSDYAKYQTIRGGAFEELSSYIYDDPTFSIEDYYMNILTADNFDGKIYNVCADYIPTSCMMLNTKISDDLTARFNAHDSVNYNDLLMWYLNLSDGQKSDYEFYFFYTIMDVLRNNFDKIINFNAKTANFYDIELMDLLENAKNGIVTEHLTYTEDGIVYQRNYPVMARRYEVLTDDNASEMLVSTTGAFFESLLPLKNRVYTMPKLVSTANGNFPFISTMRIGINKYSPHKDIAWDFIKYVISEKERPKESRPRDAMFLYINTLGTANPVNRQNDCNMAEIYLDQICENELPNLLNEDRELTMSTEEYRMFAIQEKIDIAEKLNYPYSKMNDLYIPNQRGMVWDDMYLYLTDRQSIKKTMQNIEQKVQIWLNE